jgi:two-component system NtrC family sensor kinase
MSRLRKLLAVSFRAKVLVPVIFVMVCLLAVTAWVVNQRITKQFESEATLTLRNADEGFRIWQRNRAKSLMLRVRSLRREPLVKAMLTQTTPATVKHSLPELREAAGDDVKIVLLTSTAGQLMGSDYPPGQMLPVGDFQAAILPVVKFALREEDKVDTIFVGGKLFDVVSIPVSDVTGENVSALTFAMEIGKDDAEELSRFTRSKIVLLADNQVIVNTFSTSDAAPRFVELFKELSAAPHETVTELDVKNEVLDDRHYYCAGGRLKSLNARNSMGYLLLYSYEESWQALQTTQRILMGVNAVAIILGAAVICFLVGKVTQPLRELRDSAEAVGRGDFSRRVTVHSEDECGELAQVFNQMTENLKNSREQLETTVETLKTTQAQLIQSEKLSGIGEFIAGVAHELNNPLTSVMGFSELLQNAVVNPKEKHYLELIHKCALRCQKIVQALLGFARRSAPERKAVCLNSLVEAAVEILHYQLRTSNVEAIVDLDPALPQAMVDPHQIQQVFVNLINNARQAIEAHQPKGWIKVITATHGDHVRVLIQDNGPGIPEENLSKIFDPFFTTKEVGKGTGLGLSLVYGIIKEHGGTITPRSRPGEGATFVIELPVTDKPAVVEETRTPIFHPVNSQEGVGKRVLVIDDEEPILQMVREALTPQGYEVDVASDGATALQRMSEKQYDVALCDWKMPGLNGQQVYENARTVNPALSNRMIFITGDIINERTRKFLEQQNKICLPKPFTIAEFRSAIKNILSAE